ncbi:MAG: alanine--tRNA ligase [Chitinophagaceae bacterium]|nr:alanine--tRNA ligase [Chitinophagaceae bacterium]
MTSSAIRQHFFDFFKSKGHTIVASAPIVIKDDPTLLFTNAGMNQFKDYFLGNKIPPHQRVADTQKCLRVSGKHNDLEEVGVDTYHHTMFEMLGNWSFGDPANPAGGYFKEEAIDWSWELLTKIYPIEKDRLYVTVFEGDAKEDLPRDEEAIACWKKCLLAAGFTQAEISDRIIMGNKKDNFWEMGDTGPCGPCTEIHVDTRNAADRKKVDGNTLVNNDHPQVIEIWNNVFIQYNRKKNGSLESLPAKHVDTGMGFERLVRVLQNKQSNYDTDIFSGTISEVEKLSGKKYENTDSKQDVAFRVIADHIRAIAFPVADGQLPSNTGAGYVIRRILRRAVRYYYSYLGMKQPLLYKLVPLLAKQFENVFPELDKQKDFIAKVIHEEEQNFLRTLDRGITRFNNYLIEVRSDVSGYVMASDNDPNGQEEDITIQIQNLENRKSKIIGGKFAFELYDTFGFPFDLTELMAREKNWTVDEAGFKIEMQQQKSRSRAAGVTDTSDWIIVTENGSPQFVGYDLSETKSKVLKYRKTKSQGLELYQVVLDTTPFYAESGGQVGDKGLLIFDGESINVVDTKKENDLVIHFIQKLPANISAGVIAKIDLLKRLPTQVHHSATHLLHAALRAVLGKHVAQKGSLVNEDYLRFDFSHFAKVTDDELARIEMLVNEKIRENIAVVIQQMPKEEAMKTGAMALFGEKYGDTVRVVTIDPAWSVELCGGTHVGNTGELGFFKIIQESAVGAGVRRVEALSGKAAEEYINEQLGLMRAIRGALKNPKDLSKAIENLSDENAALKKNVEKLSSKNIAALKETLLAKTVEINDINFIGEIVEAANPDDLKNLCFSLKNDLKDYVIVLAAAIDAKPFVAIMLDEKVSASKNLDASKIIKEYVAPLIKGGGGGQKTLATAGGLEAGNLKLVIEKVKQLL